MSSAGQHGDSDRDAACGRGPAPSPLHARAACSRRWRAFPSSGTWRSRRSSRSASRSRTRSSRCPASDSQKLLGDRRARRREILPPARDPGSLRLRDAGRSGAGPRRHPRRRGAAAAAAAVAAPAKRVIDIGLTVGRRPVRPPVPHCSSRSSSSSTRAGRSSTSSGAPRARRRALHGGEIPHHARRRRGAPARRARRRPALRAEYEEFHKLSKDPRVTRVRPHPAQVQPRRVPAALERASRAT